MRFSPNFLDEIRARISVSQVVGRKVTLKKAGREFRGLSPFKDEKSPSFFVNDQKGFYHCFASGEHGDIFTFLMKTEGISFEEAVTRLAKEAGVAMPSPKTAPVLSQATTAPIYLLPPKLAMLLKRLSYEYKRENRDDLLAVVTKGRPQLEEGVDIVDTFNGKVVLHRLTLTLPMSVLGQVPLGMQSEICERIRSDIRTASGVSDEVIDSLALDAEDDDETSGSTPTTPEPTSPESWAATFWKPDHVRMFLSHRDSHKVVAHAIAEALLPFGISCFVAHDTIEPDEEWQIEIEKGLRTMEIMLGLVTENFNESAWTQQEVGFALGRGVPVITVKTGSTDPRGFINRRQAKPIDAKDAAGAAALIFPIVAKRLGAARLRSALLKRFLSAENWDEVRDTFDKLSDIEGWVADDAAAIIAVYNEPGVHNSSFHLKNYGRLVDFLNRCSEKKYHRVRNRIEELNHKDEDNWPSF